MSKARVKTKEAAPSKFEGVENILCPIVVFCIGYLHHLYFSYETISPLFVGCSLVSVMLVLSYKKAGLIASLLIQCALLSYVLVDASNLFWEQVAFSLSVYAALWATYLAQDEFVQDEFVQNDLVASVEPEKVQPCEQKDALWQELFSARQEITKLYVQKQQVEERLALVEREKLDTIALIEQKIEVLEAEKSDLLEDKQEQEVDIAKLLDNMRQMAECQEILKQEATVKKNPPQSCETLQPYEAMYKQLKEQFEEKSHVLDKTRKDLFHAQEEVEVLKRRLYYEQDTPSDTEKALTEQLKKTTEKLEVLEKKHEEELVGYEEVIGRLLQQLNQGQ